jgi:hypothetical protein
MVDIIRAYTNPEKYKEYIPIEKIVVDEKVVDEGVARYENMIESGEELNPIIVIKHPKEDYYAVLDGHHRFWAMIGQDISEAPCVVINVYTNLQFKMTQKGYFQPSPLFTKYVRIPLKRFQKYMKNFIQNPKSLLRTKSEDK